MDKPEVLFPDPTFDRSEAAVARRLALLRWGPAGADPDAPACPDCGAALWQSTQRRPRRFGCSACHRQTSVTFGTALHGCKLPLWKVWTIALNLAAALRPSASALARALGLHVETAWRWRHRLCAVLATLPARIKDALRGMLCVRSVRLPIRRPHPRTPKVHPDADREQRDRAHWRGRMGVLTVMHTVDDDTACVAFAGRFVENHLRKRFAMVGRPMTWEGVATASVFALLDEVDRHNRHIFHAVSQRWLPVYAQSMAARRRYGLYDAAGLVARALAAPFHRFDALRPGATREVDDALAPYIRGFSSVHERQVLEFDADHEQG